VTVTDIRARTSHPQPEQTTESQLLAESDAQIRAVEAKQADPQGWAKELEDERARLIEARGRILAEMVALTATTVLAA
jgi:hypothetical protein